VPIKADMKREERLCGRIGDQLVDEGENKE
jgi:hypothetical protein